MSVLAIDAGTTGVRAFAVGDDGAPLGYRYREFPQHYPRPAWVEHDADDIWAAVRATVGELVSALDQPVAAVGITNQRETAVAWDRRTGRPVARAIVWQDRRTADRCDELREGGHLPLVRERTGLVLDPYFTATKLEWLLTAGGVEVTPDLAFGTVDSWLVWNLTGGAAHLTDASNASRTLLYDIGGLAWDDELCALFGVPASALPEVGPSSGRLGVTAGDTGLPERTPVSGIAGDQQAALFGQACFAPGDTKNTYGTGSFVLMNVGSAKPPPIEGLLTSVAWTGVGAGATYALEGAIFATGATVQWLRDELGILEDAAASEVLAASVPDTGGVYLVPAFAGLGSPQWDPRARGTIVGLTRGSGRAQVARAALEAMAFSTRDVVEAMTAASGHTIPLLRADGGAAANRLLLQLQADQLQVPVVRPAVAETTAYGAALLAGLAEGVWADIDEVAACWREDVTIEPSVGPEVAATAFAGWRRAVERSLAWAR